MDKSFLLSPIPLEELKSIISDSVQAQFEKQNSKPLPAELEYITRQATASFLGISLPTLNDWTKRGIIPAYRIASRVRYRKADVLGALHKVQSIKFGRK